MATPQDYKFRTSHEWVKINGKKAVIGVSDYAQHAMGDIVFINLPEVGSKFSVGDTLCDIESVKAVSEAYSPVTGIVTAVNTALEDAPELINSDPYANWIAEIEFTALGDLLSAEEYDALDKE
jgi:glycine cleavage system H protein